MEVFYAVDIVIVIVVLAVAIIKILQDAKVKKQYGKENLLCCAKLEHAYGLSFPQGAKCKAVFLRDRILFSAHNQEFSLSESKLVDVSVMKHTDIQKQYVSSAGGAIAGVKIAGPLGAMIGGSAKKRTIKSKSKYLVIAYKDAPDSPEAKYITFDITRANSKVNSIPRNYKYLANNQNEAISL